MNSMPPRLRKRPLSSLFCAVVVIGTVMMAVVFYGGLYRVTNGPDWYPSTPLPSSPLILEIDANHVDGLLSAAEPAFEEEYRPIAYESSRNIDRQQMQNNFELRDYKSGDVNPERVSERSFHTTVNGTSAAVYSIDIESIEDSVSEDASVFLVAGSTIGDLVTSSQSQPRDVIPHSVNRNFPSSPSFGIQRRTRISGRYSQRRRIIAETRRLHVVESIPKTHSDAATQDETSAADAWKTNKTLESSGNRENHRSVPSKAFMITQPRANTIGGGNIRSPPSDLGEQRHLAAAISDHSRTLDRNMDLRNATPRRRGHATKSSSKPFPRASYYNCSSATIVDPSRTDVVDWSKLAMETKPHTIRHGGWLGCRLTLEEQSQSNSTSTPSTKTSLDFDVNRFVSFSSGFLDGRGLGNQMFNLASVVYVAQMTGRHPAMLHFRDYIALDYVFDFEATGDVVFERKLVDLCPAFLFVERCPLAYDERIELLLADKYRKSVDNSSIFLSGFFQSWKYVRPVARVLRERYFVFRRDIVESTERFLTNSIPSSWRTRGSFDGDDARQFVRVGVHVRRGDVIGYQQFSFGYVTPSENYFLRAMSFFIERYRRVQFIVCGNDEKWSKEVFPRLASALSSNSSTANRVNLVFCAPARAAGEDMAVLAGCDHIIMSTGTFGWWAGWLAGGATVYYADWPIPGSNLAAQFRRDDFFPPDWIGITENSEWN